MNSKALTGIVLALVVAIALAAVQPARAQQSDNHALHAVPAGKVVVDGKLDDWDLSGQIEVYANFKTRNSYSAKVAAMYDKDNFYLSVVWRDPTPMHNMVDSNFDIGSGWKSDCLQLRLKTDMVIGDVSCWYSTAAKQPVINIQYGRFTGGQDKETDVTAFQAINDALKVGVQEAFTLGEDGKSYTQEIAIPWKLLTAQSAIRKDTGKPYKEPKTFGPGDSFQMGMEFLWGPPDGRTFPIHRYADLLAEGQTSREFFGEWTAAPAQDVSRERPEWGVLAWSEAKTFSGVGLLNAFAKEIEIDALKSEETAHPASAPESAWNKVDEVTWPVWWRPAYTSVPVPFASPVATRALRVRIVRTLSDENPDIVGHFERNPRDRNRHVRLGGVMAFTSLGDRPLPPRPVRGEEPPPLTVRYAMPYDGTVALAIDDAHGRRVRQTHRSRCPYRPGRCCPGRCAGVGLEQRRRPGWSAMSPARSCSIPVCGGRCALRTERGTTSELET